MENKFSFIRRSVSILALLAMTAGTTAAYAAVGSSTWANANDLSLSITDGKDTIAKGGNLLYVVKLTQFFGPVGYTDVVMTLPTYSNGVYPDNGGRVVGNRVIWDRIALSQGQEKIFTIQVNISQDAPEDTVLNATVQANRVQASDTTTVRGRINENPFTIKVTDNRDQVYPGQTLSYTITARNTASYEVTSDVTADVSALNSVDSVNPAAAVTYPTIRWKDVVFRPNQTKTFTFNAVMRKRVSPYTAARVSARVGNVTAVDTTVAKSLHGDPVFMTSTQLNSSTGTSSRSTASTSSTTGKKVLFTKTSDAADVVPGGTIRYTLRVQNVLLNVIRNAVITERFDPTLVSVLDANGGKIVSDGVIQWNLPTLQPGQVWTVSYTMKVASKLPNGTMINSVATLNGDDVGFATLNDKVTVSSTAVVGSLPTTGGAMDLLFSFALLPLAAAGTAFQKKLI